jgi:uroporphyrin-III C-methyltransferase
MHGMVHFVGAGPGDPELLTIKAHALLRRADVVLHDDLVAPEIVALAARHAQVINVGKRCGEKKITQAEVNEQMIDFARRGLEVVRLKSGDPGVFGRLGEEIEALEAAEILFEVVPGITGGMAAAASVGASLTQRHKSSRLVFVSAHHASQPEAGRCNDWSGLAREDTTLVVYMPGRNLATLRAELLEAGLPTDFPALIVSRVSTPEQQQWATTLGELESAPEMESPSILLLGRTLENAGQNAQSKILSGWLHDSECTGGVKVSGDW